MVGPSPGPLRRLLAPVAARLHAQQPPLSPASPGPPLMTRLEILSRYRRLRQISKQQHEAVLDIIAADVLLDWARRLDLTQGKAMISDSEYEIALAEDLAIYLAWPGRSHPLTPGPQDSRPAPTKQSYSRLCAMPASRSGASSGTTKPPV
jgi:hypothetical protein